MSINFQKVYIKNHGNLEKVQELLKKSFIDKHSVVLRPESLNIVCSFFLVDAIKNEIKLDNKEFFLLYQDSFLLGFLELQTVDKKLIINNLFIEQKFESLNLYSEVFDFVLDIFNEGNFDSLISYIPVGNIKYLNLFRQFNFLVVKQVVRYYGSGVYVYCYQLEKN